MPQKAPKQNLATVSHVSVPSSALHGKYGYHIFLHNPDFWEKIKKMKPDSTIWPKIQAKACRFATQGESL
jgi:hypothetical protein